MQYHQSPSTENPPVLSAQGLPSFEKRRRERPLAIIAEKPSVAKDIARVLGITHHKNGYIEGNGYMVTWAFGHLVTLAPPESYGIKTFPVIPTKFKLIPRQEKTDKGYEPDRNAVAQLKIIQSVFDKCDSIIVATDAGREGCLIFRYIYHYLKCDKPFSRLWISSLTDKAIMEGFAHLKPGSNYDGLYLAAQARSQADWLVGMNASHALATVTGDTNNSLGRAQTPTLAMVCALYRENRNFRPQPYWVFKAGIEKDGILFRLTGKEKVSGKEDAKTLFRKLENNKSIRITKVEKTESIQEPPLLYDLTALQQDANRQHDFSADHTLSIAQKLYEKKIISYPRTGSRYIPEDVFEEITALIDNLKPNSAFAQYASAMDTTNLNKRSVDESKITDHHALLVTGNRPDHLSPDEQTVYDMIAGRVLEAFSPRCVKEVLVVQAQTAIGIFEAKAVMVKDAGWRAVFNLHEGEGEDESGDDGMQALPSGGLGGLSLSEGEVFAMPCINLLQKSTQPKPLYSEATLLAAMEHAGKECENEDEKAALKDCGIGTPATRAAIIETLVKRGYMERDGKALKPTSKGLSVYDAVKNMQIADAQLTGEWENKLDTIEKDVALAGVFDAEIRDYTRRITEEISSLNFPESDHLLFCPKCKLGKISIRGKVAKCSYSKCNLTLFRTICGKTLTEGQTIELLKKKRTPLLKGFKSKAGKSFDACLKLDDHFNVVFEFPQNKQP